MLNPIEVLRRRLRRIRESFGAATDARELYLEATDREAFRKALEDGDPERAAQYHPRSAAEIERRMEDILSTGSGHDVEFPSPEDGEGDRGAGDGADGGGGGSVGGEP